MLTSISGNNLIPSVRLFADSFRCNERPMRRQDRCIKDKSVIKEFLDRAQYGVLALNDNGQPYAIPLHYGYEWDKELPVFYFHGFTQGRKIDILLKNDSACFTLVPSTSIINAKPNNPCSAGARFESVIVEGKASVVQEENEKIKGLERIMDHYEQPTGPFSKGNLNRTSVLKLMVEKLSAKKN